MNSNTLPNLSAIAIVLTLAACSKNEVPIPNQPALPSLPTPVPLITLPSTPESQPSKTPSNKDTLAKKPFKSMTKEEEVKGMPLPGQANDHSTPQLPSKPISPPQK